MKKLILLLCVAFSLLSVPAGASAADAVSFKTESVKCIKNRLITVDVTAECDKPFCSAVFEFSFDNSILEYRGVAACEGSTVTDADKGGVVKAVFVNPRGLDVSSGGTVFSLEFKSLAEGETEIGFSVRDCVDGDAEFMDIGSCVSGTVTVTGGADNGAQTSKDDSSKSGAKARSDEGTDSSASKSKKSESSNNEGSAEDAEGAAAETTGGETPQRINDVIQRDYDMLLPIIVLSTSVFGAIVIGFFFVNKAKKPKKTSNEDNAAE